jgi:hypothetical protein
MTHSCLVGETAQREPVDAFGLEQDQRDIDDALFDTGRFVFRIGRTGQRKSPNWRTPSSAGRRRFSAANDVRWPRGVEVNTRTDLRCESPRCLAHFLVTCPRKILRSDVESGREVGADR